MEAENKRLHQHARQPSSTGKWPHVANDPDASSPLESVKERTARLYQQHNKWSSSKSRNALPSSKSRNSASTFRSTVGEAAAAATGTSLIEGEESMALMDGVESRVKSPRAKDNDGPNGGVAPSDVVVKAPAPAAPASQGRRTTTTKEPKEHGRGASQCSTLSETSSSTDKVPSPPHEVPVANQGPTLATRRSVKELLETRETPSKMEIGEGVFLTADIKGAELVIIRGIFQGDVKAICVDIEQGAQVNGTIECEAARINGAFDGEFLSSQSLHLASHANVSGRIIYRRLKVSKGAQLHGHAVYRSPVLSAK